MLLFFWFSVALFTVKLCPFQRISALKMPIIIVIIILSREKKP